LRFLERKNFQRKRSGKAEKLRLFVDKEKTLSMVQKGEGRFSRKGKKRKKGGCFGNYESRGGKGRWTSSTKSSRSFTSAGKRTVGGEVEGTPPLSLVAGKKKKKCHRCKFFTKGRGKSEPSKLKEKKRGGCPPHGEAAKIGKMKLAARGVSSLSRRATGEKEICRAL